MKLIIQNNRVAGTATDAYTGPEQYIDAPVDFDVMRMSEYVFTGGVLSLPPAPRYLSKLGFRNRFAMAEKAGLEMAALDNPAAPIEQRMAAATLRAVLADQRDATYIDPQRADTRAGVFQLETFGIIGVGRALQILDAPIQDLELFKG